MAAVFEHLKIVMRRAFVAGCALVLVTFAGPAHAQPVGAGPQVVRPDSTCGLSGLKETPPSNGARAWRDRDGDFLVYQTASASDDLPDLSDEKAVQKWCRELAEDQGGELIEARRVPLPSSGGVRMLFKRLEGEKDVYTGVFLVNRLARPELWVMIARKHGAGDPLSKVRRVLDALPCPALLAPHETRQIVVDTTGLDRPANRGGLPRFGEYVYVEELPVAITKVPPVYPPEARRKGVDGTVMLQVLVGVDGTVADTRIVKSIPALDPAAVAAARQWRFKPALSKGKPVAVWVAIPIRFTLN